MDNKRLRELAGIQVNDTLNEDYVDTVANDIPTGDIIEGLAIHCLENDISLNQVISELKDAYIRSKKGREEYNRENPDG